MAGVTLDVKIEDQKVKELLGLLASRMTNLRPVMRLIGEIVVESVQSNFDEHRSPEGTPWKPLSAGYLKWKVGKKGRNPGDILMLNRVLRNSIRQRPENTGVLVGTDTEYAAIHQFGGFIRGGLGGSRGTGTRKAGQTTSRKAGSRRTIIPMPARPFLGVRAADWPKIREVVEHFLTKGES